MYGKYGLCSRIIGGVTGYTVPQILPKGKNALKVLIKYNKHVYHIFLAATPYSVMKARKCIY